MTYEDCALRVVSTVVSRPNPTRAVLDAGWRILSNNEIPNQSTYGHILEYPQARVMRLYTEHAVVEFLDGGEPALVLETLSPSSRTPATGSLLQPTRCMESGAIKLNRRGAYVSRRFLREQAVLK